MALIQLRPSLRKRGHPLAAASDQRSLLRSLTLVRTFATALNDAGAGSLRRSRASILQMNLGKRCNQTCRHCHVDAGPDRQEMMQGSVLDTCLSLLESRSEITTVDLTGGAPELHPRFKDIVKRVRKLNRRVIDRCNLTVTLLPNYADLPEFFAAHRVEVVASLPWYAPKQTDAQRGDGVFEASIIALQNFNRLGYGQAGTGLVLNLVTNPAGAFLPAGQKALEREWKLQLERRYGITFNALYTITNMPVSRFLEFLVDSGNLGTYMDRLLASFNPASIEGLMCRSTLSVGWDGQVYDCDFNQMLEMPRPEALATLVDQSLEDRDVLVGEHCFGCTAGSGSSCGGATVKGEHAA